MRFTAQSRGRGRGLRKRGRGKHLPVHQQYGPLGRAGKEWDFVKPGYPGETIAEIRQDRVPVKCLDPEDRKGNFCEVYEGYTEEQALLEASRCLECGVCSECYECLKACQPNAINHEMQARTWKSR
jgi:hypothetical protein